ncbi:hypothetical protein BVC71_10185 [Marivivens niveibacter]|uniref:Uncharacterized protein n=2 Tax=Marivivens niveibacter TaxID=1930667 RepID=A0A251WYQ0_9RHOB|nr:hypothetical protein BVC71_10185 [Marivivens niveibacter]
MGMTRNDTFTETQASPANNPFECTELAQRAMDLLDRMTKDVLLGKMDRMTDYFAMPHALQYSDELITITNHEEMLTEFNLITFALRQRNVAKVEVNFTRQSPARNDHLPVWVQFRLLDIDGTAMQEVGATYFCELVDDQIKIKLAQFQAPRAPILELVAALQAAGK